MSSDSSSEFEDATRRMRRVYRRFAPVYDVVTLLISMWRWRRWQQRALGRVRGRVLDVGCGTGVVLRQLVGRSQATGLDLSLDMLAKAARRQTQPGPAAALVCGDAQHLPFRDGSFESVVSTFAINAVPDLKQALTEMLRVLQAGGSLAFISVGESERGGPATRLVAGIWRLEGDIIRDEVSLLRELGVEPQREDFGPFGTIHLISVTKPYEPAR